MRIAVIDVGNTSTTLGLYENGSVSRITNIHGGINANPEACSDMLRLISSEAVEGVSIASVVPAANSKWKKLMRDTLGCTPRFVSHESPLNFQIDYPNPERIGTDRLADAAGGVARYGSPLIIMDFGTALNFEVIDSRPAYIGGVLAPGVSLMTDYLHEKTALLPKVEVATNALPPPAIGKSTEEAIIIGAEIGFTGIVKEILNHLQKQFSGPAKVIATGGYAKWFLSNQTDFNCRLDEDLTLFGLGVIFEAGGSD